MLRLRAVDESRTILDWKGQPTSPEVIVGEYANPKVRRLVAALNPSKNAFQNVDDSAPS